MNELWRVQGVTGAVRMMSLDDIDRAFNAGYLNEKTYVLAPGSLQWQTLGEAAGLEDAPSEQTPSLSPMAIASGPSSYALPQIPQHSALSFDDDAFEPKKSRKGLVFGFFVAAAAAACAFALTTGRLHLPSGSHAEAAMAVQPPAAETKLPEPAATPKGEEAKPVQTGLSDEQRQRLLDADKAKAKKNAKGKRRYQRNQPENDVDAPIPTPEAKSLVQGGDKFDPLNGSL